MRFYNETFTDNVRYYLLSESTSEQLYIKEPIGYKDDTSTISRDLKFLGIKRSVNGNLMFYKEGSDEKDINGYYFINRFYKAGVKEIVWLFREEENENGVYETIYGVPLDFSTYTKNQNEDGGVYIQIKASDKGLDSFLNARKNEDIDVSILKTIEGDFDLQPLKYETVLLSGRALPLNSIQNTQTPYSLEITNDTFTPLTDLIYANNDSFQAIVSNNINDIGSYFYAESGKAFTSADFKILFEYEIQLLSPNGYSFNISYRKNSGTPIVINTYNNITNGTILSDTFELSTDVALNDSFQLYIDSVNNTGSNKVIKFLKWKISILTDSKYGVTTTKAYNCSVLLERLLHSISGKQNSLVSSFLETTGKNFFLTDGKLIRNYPIEEVDEYKKKSNLKISINTILESLDATWNLGVGIERYGFKDYLVVEDKKHFFQQFVSIELGKLSNIKRSVASEFFYSGIEIGYEGSNEVTDYSGIFKTNGITKYSTTFSEFENKYIKLSKIQTDDFLIEDLRRNQYVLNPELEHKEDDSKFFLDCSENISKSEFRFEITTDLVSLNGTKLYVKCFLGKDINVVFRDVIVNEDTDVLIGVNEANTLSNLRDFLIEKTEYTGVITVPMMNLVLSYITITEKEHNGVQFNEFSDGFGNYLVSNIINIDKYIQRNVLDDYETLPTGVYDAINLKAGRWTPTAMLLRHGWWLNSAFEKYRTEKLKFISKDKVNVIKGTLKNDENFTYLKGIEYSDTDNINVSDLDTNLFSTEWVEGDHVVTNEVFKKLNGYTVISGKKVSNFYGLVSFINEDDEPELGYVFKVSPNGKGSWRILTFKEKISKLAGAFSNGFDNGFDI